MIQSYYHYARPRSRTDWAGVTMGDAFKPEVDFYTRIPAQNLFYRAVARAQANAADLARGGSAGELGPMRVKPQLSPFYTDFPSVAAARAAIGWTAWLEFEARSAERSPKLAEHLAAAAPGVPPRVAMMVANAVRVRITLEEMRRRPKLGDVELYRLFLANLHPGMYRSLKDVLDAVTLYADVVPCWRGSTQHPLTLTLLEVTVRVSIPVLRSLRVTPVGALIGLGKDWVRALCQEISPFLPSQTAKEPLPDEVQGTDETADDTPLPPLLGAAPPVIETPGELEGLAASASPGRLGDVTPEPTPLGAALSSLSKAASDATAQPETWEAPRRELLERSVREAAWREGPIQGTPSDGHEVRVQMGGTPYAGQVFDRPAPLSDDVDAVARLKARARPVSEALRRALHPSVENLPERDRLLTGGSLDPARLPLLGVAAAVFQRHRTRPSPSPRGRAVLLIACDGSGSLSAPEMQMTKLLAAAWLDATATREVEVLAGLYHSGSVRGGAQQGTLIQWMCHPRKTPTLARREAVRAVASLPETGTGIQADVLSLAFMLKEARALARGGMVYLTLITDTSWNTSFRSSRSGKEEMLAWMAAAQAEGMLHTTLVALGISSPTGFEDTADKVVLVPSSSLSDPAAVAGNIATYVATCVVERRRAKRKSR